MTPSTTNDGSLDFSSIVAESSAPARSTQLELYLSARALLVFVFMIFIFTIAARQIVDPDFWWHLKTGQFLVQTRSIPQTDIFSNAFAGKEWIAHEWLSEVLIYAIYRVLGFGGLIVTFALLITAGFAIAYRRCAQKAAHPYVAGAALVLGALAAAPTWGVRPQVFTFLLASIFLSVLYDYQDEVKRGSIWWLIPLMVLWVNLHAGFAIGIVLILLVIVGITFDSLLSKGEALRVLWLRVRSLCVVLIGCIAAVLLNPSGARMYSYPFETLTSQAMMKYIDEWHSPDFHELMFQPLALLILFVFAALALSRKRIGLAPLLLLIATAFGALRSGRNVPFFVLVAMPLLAEHSWDWLTAQRWGQWLAKPEKREVGAGATLKIALNVLLLVAAPLTLAVLRVHRNIATQAATEAQQFPAAAVAFMRVHNSPQPIFNEYGWGGYLIWQTYPDYRVHIDGRADVYGDAFIEEFLATQAGQGKWQESLTKHGIRTVLIKPETALATLLRQDNGWQKVFEDSQSVVFEKP